MFISITCMGQSKNDSNRISSKKLHITSRLQEGYGLTLGWFGGEGKTNGNHTAKRNIYFLGITDTKIGNLGHGAFVKSAMFEINNADNEILYGLSIGADMKAMIFDFGFKVNYSTNFSNYRSLAFSPRIGLTFAGFGINLDIMFEYDMYLIKPNFEDVTKSTVGCQYTIGFLKRDYK
ncbi:MAG: hypothetical protein NTZ33_08140 [Bacteroidetes bacterium]|nr:hypothetical protein [Bacteroidota bacterium]